ncbi:TolC family protein [Acetobacter papayae]|uniref:TolC family protein n=1 Tax=Acetobacter papayae TaxID=1076592 RepID=UPI000470865D|nr:TolC family protein [Acetobacter papayae]
MSARPLPFRAVVLALPVALAACSPFHADIPPSHVTIPAGTAAEASAGRVDLTHWWTDWHDPRLTKLVEEALAANPELRQARDRVEQARAYTKMAKSSLYPTIGATGSIAGGGMNWRQATPPLASSIDPNLGDPMTDGHLAGVGIAWEPDVFGHNTATLKASRAMELTAQDLLHGAHMTIAADVASSYLSALGISQRLALLDRSEQTLESLLAYATARFEAGQTNQADLESIRAQIEALRGSRPVLVAAYDTFRRRLAILSGRTPDNAPDLSGPDTFSIPAPPRAMLPSTILSNRPDILLRRHMVEAAAQRLVGAKTELLPRFGLEFFGGDGRLRFDGIPGLSGTGGLAALTATLPIFTAGRIHAQIAQADSRLDEAVAAYDQTLLNALAEIENASEQRSQLDTSAAALQARTQAASTAATMSHGLFEGGQVTLQDVLTARLRLIDAQDELVKTQTARALSTVRLARALGGGWSASAP